MWIFRAKIGDSSSDDLVLHVTSNLIISRRHSENGKEMYKNGKTHEQGVQNYCFC